MCTKITARPSSGGLWLARARYGHYIKEKRRALQYLEEEDDEEFEEGGASAACYSTEAALSQVGELHCNPVVLQEVCRYLVGHSLYVSLVCKSWKDCHEIAAAQTEPTFAVVPDDDDDGDDSDVDCTQADIAKEKRVGSANITLYQAAFASAATAVWAYENDLDLNDDAVTRSAGKYGSLEALVQIYKLDGTWDGALTNGAAARGCCLTFDDTLAATTQCITGSVALQCPYDQRDLASAAARSGSIELFTWLLDTGVIKVIEHYHVDDYVLYSSFIRDSLIAAVEAGHLHMCKHLLQLLDNAGLIAADCVAYAAAKTRNKQLLQWLQADSGLTVSESDLFQYATEVPKQDLATVLWLLEQGYTLPKEHQTDAGCKESDVPLAKLLRERGAVWPDQLGHSALDRCWCAAVVAWARAEDCAAPALAVDADDGADDGDY
eukprot:14574-Heterococcus_DN1.PRE.1